MSDRDDLEHERLRRAVESSPTNDPRVLAAGWWFARQGWNLDINHSKHTADAEFRHGANQKLDLLSLVHAILNEETP